MSPAPGLPGVERGYIIPIGGAEDHVEKPVVLERFARLCGGAEAVVIIIPTASRRKEAGARYVQTFERLGVGEAVSIPLRKRADCQRTNYLDALGRATGIFLTGGSQLRLSTILGGTPIARRIRRRNAEGVHIAGTSAGAAIMPEHMIAAGKSGPTPRPAMVTLAPGLGLTNSLIIDQHFRQRDRLGRLLAAVSYNPFLIGVGLDEDTALFLGPDGVFEVVGSGVVTVVDPSALQHSSMSSAQLTDPVTLIGLTLHILTRGARYNTVTRQASLR